jgi:hypothetical protein
MSPSGNPNEWQGTIPGLPALTTVFYYFTGATASGLNGQLPLTAPDNDRFVYHVGLVNPIVQYDFETPGDQGFTHGANFGTDDWEHGMPLGLGGDPGTAFSGENVWGNDLSVDGCYSNSSSSWLETPPIDLTGVLHTCLDFRRWLGVEGGYWDQARVFVNGVQVYVNPADSGDLIDRNWTHQMIDISSIADDQPSVVVRFQLDTDFTTCFGGWTIDDVRILELVDPAHDCKPSFNYGTGSVGSGGFTPRIFAVNGPANLGNASFRIQGDQMLGGTVAALLLGAGKSDTQVGPLHILVDLSLPHVFFPTAVNGIGAGGGTAGVGLPIPSDSAFADLKFYAQWMVTDPAGYAQLALSNGLETEICSNP